MADITFVPTLAGFLFLAIVMDAWSRRIAGWAFSADLKTRVGLDALDMAFAARKPENVIHHSDQGSKGGFNRSSQHLNQGACDGRSKATVRSVWKAPVAITGGDRRKRDELNSSGSGWVLRRG